MFLSNRGSFRPETSGAYTLRRRGRRRPKSGSAIGACAVARLAGSGGPIGDYYGSANKLLPKRRGISFDDLEAADMAAVMSQLNSEPRPSMAFMPPLRALLAAYGDDGAALTAALGVEEVPYGELLLGVEAVNRARLERGADPLI